MASIFGCHGNRPTAIIIIIFGPGHFTDYAPCVFLIASQCEVRTFSLKVAGNRLDPKFGSKQWLSERRLRTTFGPREAFGSLQFLKTQMMLGKQCSLSVVHWTTISIACFALPVRPTPNGRLNHFWNSFEPLIDSSRLPPACWNHLNSLPKFLSYASGTVWF